MIRFIYRRKYSTESDFHPHSTIQYLSKAGLVFKKTKAKKNVEKIETQKSPVTNEIDGYRENEMKIQMISKSLYNQIFGNQDQYPKIGSDLIQK